MGRTGTVGRRALLTAGAATLVGCTSDGGGGERPRKRTAAERAALAEAALRRGSVTTSLTLLERYDAVLAAHPSLTERLAPLRRAVAAHAAALAEGVTPLPTGGETGDPEGAEAKAAGTDGPKGEAARTAGTRPADTPGATAAGTAPAPGATTSPGPAPVPADPAAALKDLAAAVRGTADAHTATLLDAPPEYARLLASVAAAGAAHAYLLTEGGRA
ncbi:hypothetical protein AB0D99_35290 [Streptomyces sp. NPDC047971]|uniref:hypothetical protein n=1 Tax=Streptomyces sp. NPDC047971 TaxID=3154499 RepID=UPI0033F9FB99